jgi:hypothetical protein
MQCKCGAELDVTVRTRIRDDPGTFRIWSCRSCGRHEERRLNEAEQRARERAMFKAMGVKAHD